MVGFPTAAGARTRDEDGALSPHPEAFRVLYEAFRLLDCDTALDSGDRDDCASVADEAVRALLAAGLLVQSAEPIYGEDPIPRAAAATLKWGELKVGQTIDFRHRNRSQRRAGREPQIRRGRIERIWYPADRETTQRLPQIHLTVLKQDGTPHVGASRFHTLYHEYAIEDVVRIVEAKNAEQS